jgi:hypothetical protein
MTPKLDIGGPTPMGTPRELGVSVLKKDGGGDGFVGFRAALMELDEDDGSDVPSWEGVDDGVVHNLEGHGEDHIKL